MDSDPYITQKIIEDIVDIDWLYYGVRLYQLNNIQLAMLTIDFVIFNPNYNRYVYTYVAFQIDGSGEVTPSVGASVSHFFY